MPRADFYLIDKPRFREQPLLLVCELTKRAYAAELPLLILAREEAQLRGATIRFEADDAGYRFAILRERRWQTLIDDRDLRPRRWDQPTQVRVRRQDQGSHVEFRLDEVDLPFVVQLRRGDGEETIVSAAPGMIGVRK